MNETIATIAIYALPVIFAITLHEAAHGYAAKHFGDPTAWKLGRVSANPLRHIDPVGTILVPLILSLIPGGIMFGWAKPVPVNFGGLKNPKKDMLWVAAAGPGANLLMIVFWALIAKIALGMPYHVFHTPMLAMGLAGVQVNASLMLLNLLPILPLDGGRMTVSLLPGKLAWRFAQTERYGFIVLVVLLTLHALDWILVPLMRGTMNFVFSVIS